MDSDYQAVGVTIFPFQSTLCFTQVAGAKKAPWNIM